MPSKYEPTVATGEWVTLESHSAVRCVDLDDMGWMLGDGTEISDFHVACCPFGGLTAIAHRQKGEIAIYTAQGGLVTPSTPISHDSNIRYMCWNEKQEHLIAVTQDGFIFFLDAKLNPVAGSLKAENPMMFTPLDNGLAIISESLRATVLTCQAMGSGEYRARWVDLSLLSEPPSALLAVSCDVSMSGFDELFIAPTMADISDKSTLYRAVFSTPPKISDAKIEIAGGSVVKIAASPVNRRVALMSSDGSLYCCEADLSELRHLHSTGTVEPPADLVWVGENCIAYIHLARQFDEPYDSVINLIDPRNSGSENTETLHEIPADFICVPECDGFRIVSKDKHQFVQVVPECAYRALRQSTSPAAQLVAAYDLYMEDDSTGVPVLRKLTESSSERLAMAVEDCIESSGFEWELERQQRFLRIASYGKSFCSTFDTELFSDMCRRLRVLRACSDPSIGMLFTMNQLRALEGERLTKRLVALDHYQLAFEICRSLDLPPDELMLQWAKKKVSASGSTTDVARCIVEKMSLVRGLSFSTVAEAAYNAGKEDLAVELLKSEPYAENQVPVLMRMHYEELALTKAIESGNADLIFMVLTGLITSRGSAAAGTLLRFPTSRDMLLTFCLNCDSQRHILQSYYKENPTYESFLALLQYLREQERMRRNHIEAHRDDGWDIIQVFKSNAAEAARLSLPPKDDEHKATSKLLKLQETLLEEQTTFAKQTKRLEFLNASVRDTIQLLFECGKGEKAESIKTMFAVSDKMFWWCKLKGLIVVADFDAIDKMGGAGAYKSIKVKSPIGFDAFVMELFNAGHPERAAAFIPKVAQIEDRMEFYCLCEDWEGAIRDCVAHKEYGMMQQLKDRARHDSRAVELIDRALRQVNAAG